MLNEFFIKIPYLLCFIPLIASLLINFINGKRFLTNFTYSVIFTVTILSLNLVFHLTDYNYMLIVNSTKNFNVLGCEFKIGTYNIFILISILFVNFIGFANYIHEIILNKSTNLIHIKHFFSIYLIYIFSIVGIMTTTNILHLFIFLELYSFCIYMIISMYNKRDLTILSYRYFSNSIFGSILSMLSIFYIIMYFNTSNIFIIKQQLLTISLKDNINIFLMFLMFIASIIIKFFNTNISKHYNTDNIGVNFLSISNMFINTLIGIYLVSEVIYFIFSGESITSLFYINKIMVILSSFIIIYNSYFLFIKKHTNTIFNIFTRFNLISFGYLILITFIGYNANSIKILSIFIIDFISINMLLYFFSAYISAKFDVNNISILNNDKKLKYFFIFIILFKIFLPIGTSLYININFIKYIFEHNYLLLIIPFMISKIAMMFLLYRIIIDKDSIDYNKDKILNVRYINTLLYSIILIFIFILFFNLAINLI